jgi:hypothetical protein
MLANSIRQSVYCDELQLGSCLNHCIESGHQATFSLWLSLLSPDVCDQPQFDFVPESSELAAINWRVYFQLDSGQSLYANDKEWASEIKRKDYVQNGSLVALHLDKALKQPSFCYEKPPHIDLEVINNLSLLAQLKYRQRHQSDESVAHQDDVEQIKPAAMVHVLEGFDYSKPLTLATA